MFTIFSKQIQKIALLGLLGIVLSSCDLTLLPEDSVTPVQFFKTRADLELWSNQFYTMLNNPDTDAGVNADDMIDKSMGAVIEGTRSPASESGRGRICVTSTTCWSTRNCPDEAHARVQWCCPSLEPTYFDKVRRYGDVPWYTRLLVPQRWKC